MDGITGHSQTQNCSEKWRCEATKKAHAAGIWHDSQEGTHCCVCSIGYNSLCSSFLLARPLGQPLSALLGPPRCSGRHLSLDLCDLLFDAPPHRLPVGLHARWLWQQTRLALARARIFVSIFFLAIFRGTPTASAEG